MLGSLKKANNLCVSPSLSGWGQEGTEPGRKGAGGRRREGGKWESQGGGNWEKLKKFHNILLYRNGTKRREPLRKGARNGSKSCEEREFQTLAPSPSPLLTLSIPFGQVERLFPVSVFCG